MSQQIDNDLIQGLKASLSVSGEMLNVESILMSVSEMVLFLFTVLLPKQQFRVTHVKLLQFDLL